ncbi:CopG family antitoxin [Candidatus Acidulodesulfobacterium sp. H_13]|uniref:CopG family antitoxin n=1 Tax=Candidatus Acidulodesulfobacterium sp. H_13 TaxID=3395470 RepID=UPI003AF4755B
MEYLNNKDIDSVENDKKNIEDPESTAKSHIERQDKKITLRISESELNRIKLIASKGGLRYQTFIKSILRQYMDKDKDYN